MSFGLPGFVSCAPGGVNAGNVGDVDFGSAAPSASLITPSPAASAP